jgi:hypothetical protein
MDASRRHRPTPRQIECLKGGTPRGTIDLDLTSLSLAISERES